MSETTWELDNVALWLADSCSACTRRAGFYDGGEFALVPGGWSRLLSIAQAHGWQPAGTHAPPPDVQGELPLWHGAPSEWDGSYWPGLGQLVTAPDALALAAALQRAWPDLPAHGTFAKEEVTVAAGVVHIKNPPVTLATTPLELYSGAWRGEVGMLAAHIARRHCRACAEFEIWSFEVGPG